MERSCLLNTVARIFIGPYFIGTTQSGLVNPEVEHVGVSLELSGDQFAATLPIHRRKSEVGPGEIELTGYLIRKSDLEFGVRYLAPSWDSPLLGEFVTLESVLAALYHEHHPATPLFTLLEECRKYLPLNSSTFSKRRQVESNLLRADVRAAGYTVLHFFKYGRTLSIRLGWTFPQDRQNPNPGPCLYAASIDCRPTPARTLGKGVWLPPQPYTLWFAMAKQLKTFYRKDPLELLSPEGVAAALECITWTKVFLLTPKEIRQCRVEFVREHPELLDKPTEMAKAMIAAGLYTDTTQLTAIKKQLLGLVAEGGLRK